MNLKDLLYQKKLIRTTEEGRKLVFERKISINGQKCNSDRANITVGDLVKVNKIEILVI